MLIALFFNLSSTLAESISTQYENPQNLVVGQAVSIDSEDTQSIVAANLDNRDYFVGIVQYLNDTSIAVAEEDAEVGVTVSGEANALVSDIAGEVSEGDALIVSAVDGVLQKRTDETLPAVAVALADFDTSTAAVYESIEFTDGSEQDISVNSVRIRLLSGAGAAAGALNADNSGLLSFIAGKDVSTARTIFALVIFVASLGAAVLYTYSSIKGSFVSLGRNPLASGSILSGVAQVSLLSVVILTIGSAASYVVLVV